MRQQARARRIVAIERSQHVPAAALAPHHRGQRQHEVADRAEGLPARPMLTARRDGGAVAVDGKHAADREIPRRRMSHQSQAGLLEEPEQLLHGGARLRDHGGRTGLRQAHPGQMPGRVDQYHARPARRCPRQRQRGPAMRAAERPHPIPVPPRPVDHRDDLVRRARRTRPHAVDLDRPRPVLEPLPRHRDVARESARRTRGHGTRPRRHSRHRIPRDGAARQRRPGGDEAPPREPRAHHATATHASLHSRARARALLT